MYSVSIEGKRIQETTILLQSQFIKSCDTNAYPVEALCCQWCIHSLRVLYFVFLH